MMHPPQEIFRNLWIAAGLSGWFLAQACKIVSAMIQRRPFRLSTLVSTGGMPSAHSAAVTAAATAIGFTEGWDSPLFAVAFVVATITMFDASTLRLNAGRQAQLLNRIAKELFQNHRLAPEPLKELLGHTRAEVFMGMLTGIATGLFVVAEFGGRFLCRP